MSFVLLVVGLLVFILGLPFLVAAIAMVVLGLRAIAIAVAGYFFSPARPAVAASAK